MHHFIYPDKDATLYKLQNTQNTGLDEIIEIEKSYYHGTLREVARGLIDFDLSSISQSIVGGDIGLDAQFFLNLKITEANQVPLEYTVYAYPVSQSWEMGIGTKYDGYTTTGVTWLYRDSVEEQSKWVEGTTLSPGTLNAGTTGSVDGSGGGTWYTSSAASQSYYYESSDIRMDVTNIVREWLSGSIQNEGFILKYSEEFESDLNDYGSLKFYSRDTNTIFPPTLEVAWDDSSIVTGSLSVVNDEDRIVWVSNLRQTYRRSSKPRFRVKARTKYPSRTFTAGNPYETSVGYLPTSSYYSIRDAETEHTIIPFSDQTKLSVDSDGSYFDQWLAGFQPERYYEVIIKIEHNDNIDFYSLDNKFRVIR